VFRQEIVREMSNYIEALKSVDLQELYDAIELEAENFENNFV